MAINSPFFLDAVDLATATAVYLDLALTNIAPDGFYGDGTITREQSSGILLTAEACDTCATPCGTSISGSGTTGIYIINLDAGTTLGAVLVKFFPQNVPDGIRVTYDGVVYNKLSSPAYGPLQSSNYGHYTIVGASSSVSTCSSWYPSGGTLPSLPEYLWNGISFAPTGGTQSVTIDVGDIQVSTTSPLFCVMVIPKIAASPNLVNIEIIGPCSGTGWDIVAQCPGLLPPVLLTASYPTSSVPCSAPINVIPNYFVSVQNTPAATVGLYDYIFDDENGEFPTADGYYGCSNMALPYNVIQIIDGVVIGISTCI